MNYFTQIGIRTEGYTFYRVMKKKIMGPTINVAWNKALVPLFAYTTKTLLNISL